MTNPSVTQEMIDKVARIPNRVLRRGYCSRLAHIWGEIPWRGEEEAFMPVCSTTARVGRGKSHAVEVGDEMCASCAGYLYGVKE